MDKKEILEKSRNDNKNQDERERFVLSKSPYFGLMALFTVSTILAFYRKFGLSGASISDLLALDCAALFGMFLYLAARLKRFRIGWALFALGFLVLTILHLADYITQGW